MLNIRFITVNILKRVAEYARDECPKSKGPARSDQLLNMIDIRYTGNGTGSFGVFNHPYAAAVHNGRKAITIRPNLEKNPPLGNRVIKSYKKRARLKFTIGGRTVFAKGVKQKARAANPPLGNRVIKGGKESYKKRARLKFTIGGRTVFAKEVKQKARAANPFLTRAVVKLQSEGFQFLVKILKKEVSDDVAKNLIKKIEIDFSI